MSPPVIHESFHHLADIFFKLRYFCGGIDTPITPALIESLGEYTSNVERDILYKMDRSYRSGWQRAKEYWKDK